MSLRLFGRSTYIISHSNGTQTLEVRGDEVSGKIAQIVH